jgi:hypothetical protein
VVATRGCAGPGADRSFGLGRAGHRAQGLDASLQRGGHVVSGKLPGMVPRARPRHPQSGPVPSHAETGLGARRLRSSSVNAQRARFNIEVRRLRLILAQLGEHLVKHPIHLIISHCETTRVARWVVLVVTG